MMSSPGWAPYTRWELSARQHLDKNAVPRCTAPLLFCPSSETPLRGTMAGLEFDDADEVHERLLADDKQDRGQEREPRRRPTPLPKLQIAVLLFFQLAEPITSQCIYPFVNQVRGSR